MDQEFGRFSFEPGLVSIQLDSKQVKTKIWISKNIHERTMNPMEATYKAFTSIIKEYNFGTYMYILKTLALNIQMIKE